MVTVRSNTLAARTTCDNRRIAPIILGHSKGKFGTGPMFLDFARSTGINWEDWNLPVDNRDANGYPTEIIESESYLRIKFTRLPLECSGEYLIRWSSDVELEITSGDYAVVTNSTWVSGQGTADLTLTGGNVTAEFRIRLPGGVSGPLTGFSGLHILEKRIVSGGKTGIQLFDEGKNWHPDYLDMFRLTNAKGETLRPLGVRYMDLNRVNEVIEPRGSGDVPTLSSFNWTYEIPPLLAVEFANEIKPVYSWWCFPIKSDSAYRQEIMTILKTSTQSIHLFENGNELWNTGFSATQQGWAEAVTLFSDLGAAANFKSTNASGAGDVITLDTGEGANVSLEQVAVFDGRFVGEVAAIDGDVITIDRNYGMTGTAKTAVFGGYNDRFSFHSYRLEEIRQDAEAVFDNDSQYATVLTTQYSGTVNPRYFTTPIWLEVDPDRPDPATRHDAYSIATYYAHQNKGITASMLETWQTDQAAAITAHHDAMMFELGEVADDMAALRVSLDEYAPDMMILPYEGGPHSVSGALNVSPYTTTEALELHVAWREDGTKAAEAAAAWWDMQKANLSAACHYLIADSASTTGYWGLIPNYFDGADAYGAAVLEESTGDRWGKFKKAAFN